MSITHNGKEYGATKVINYSAAPDYNRGIAVNNIQTGNYQATDNGFLFIQLQSQQSNPTKVSVVRSKTPITNTGTEIASIVLSQYQYSETLTAQVMAREYYKLVIEGAGNPQVISCMFYPYASTVPMKLTENITVEQVEGLESELAGKQDKGNYFNKDTDILGVNKGGTGTNDGFGWRNSFNRDAFFQKINFTAGGTTQEFIHKLPIYTFTKISGYVKIPHISDLPRSEGTLDIIVQDSNTKILILYAPYNYEEWLYTTNSNVGKGWIRIRNADGSIPANLIPPTILKYTNSDGIWKETKLTTGETMLDGSGHITNFTTDVIITLPKRIKQGTGVVIVNLPYFCPNSNTIIDKFLIRKASNLNNNNYTMWEFKGFLA